MTLEELEKQAAAARDRNQRIKARGERPSVRNLRAEMECDLMVTEEKIRLRMASSPRHNYSHLEQGSNCPTCGKRI